MLLDRFRTAPRHKDPDPLVRLTYIVEIPMDDRETIASIAQGDEDSRVRRAAVAKLLDPAVLGRIAVSDGDAEVRHAAAGMLRDIALDAFEEAGETEALDAVDAMQDAKLLAQVAKSAGRDIVALRAVSRLTDGRALGSVARHAVVESVRRAAFDQLVARGDRAELLAVAMNGEYKDTAVAAIESVADEGDLENIATRSRNKAASKRARGMLKEIADQRALADAEAVATARLTAVPVQTPVPALGDMPAPLSVVAVQESAMPEASAEPGVESANDAAATAAPEPEAPPAAEAETAPQAVLEATRQRMIELVAQAEQAAGDTDVRHARKQLRIVRGEWRDLAAHATEGLELVARLDEADRRVAAREVELREADERARRDALARVQQLLKRVATLVADPAPSGAAKPGLHALERALRDVRHLAAAMPMLPTKADADEALARIKAAQAALTPRVQELREAEEWQQWANVTIQEQLCAKMEALQALDDPERIAAEVKSLQQQWRQAANVPSDKADALWRRFKAAHDVVWPRCEAHFHAEAQLRGEHLARKIALCEQAEALASSSNWIQAADEIKRLQEEWKNVGPVARAQEKSVWERFHAACNRFFTRRHDDLVQRKAVWAQNLAKKAALCEQAEQLAASTEWDSAATELKRLQAEWRTIGPVRKNKADAIWQRFRAASDTFFGRYAHRHDTARAERIEVREALSNELSALSADEATEAPADLQQTVQRIRQRWQEEASRPLDPATARALEERFTTAMSQVIERWPAAFAGGDLDVAGNTQRLESLVGAVESLARSLTGPAAPAAPAGDLSPTVRLAAMLKEALAANTIGGKVDPRAEEENRLRAAAEEVRRAQSNWSRIGFVPADVRRPLADRFDRASRAVLDRANAVSRPAAAPRSAAPRRDAPRERRGR